jgi:hypothetical protein
MYTHIFNAVTVVINPESRCYGRFVRVLGVAPTGEPPFLASEDDLRRAGGLTEAARVEVQELRPDGLPMGSGISYMKPSELLLFTQIAAAEQAGATASYKTGRDRDRKAALDKLAAISQELGGYEELNDPEPER